MGHDYRFIEHTLDGKINIDYTAWLVGLNIYGWR